MLEKRVLSFSFVFISLITYALSSTGRIIKYKMTLLPPVIDDDNILGNSILNKINYEIPTINLCLGTPRQCYPFSFSFNNPFLYVLGYKEHSLSLRFYDYTKSSTFDSSSDKFLFVYQSINCRGMNSTDVLRGNEEFNAVIQPTKFNFYTIVDDNEKYKRDTIAGVIGLSKNFPNKNHSYLYNFVTYLNYLHSNGFIQDNTMVFRYNDINGGEMSFGENWKNRALPYCSSNTGGNNRWICKFHQFKIGYSKYINKFVFIFDPSYPFIYGPSYAIFHLFKLMSYLSKRKCQIEKENEVSVFTCDEDVDVNKFSDFVLMNQNSELRIKMKNAFKVVEINGSKRQVCLIIGLEEAKEFLLGLPAFNNNVLVFDQDQLMIFFPNENYDIVKDSNNSNNNNNRNDIRKIRDNKTQISASVLIGLLLCGIGFQIWIRKLLFNRINIMKY